MQKQRQNHKHKKQLNSIDYNDQKRKMLQKYMDYQNYNLSFGRSRQIRRQRMTSSIYNNPHYQGIQSTQGQRTDERTPKDIGKTEKIYIDPNHLRFKTMDVDSFKVEDNLLEHRYSTIKRNSKDNNSDVTKKEVLQKQEDFLKSAESNSHAKQIIVQDYTIKDEEKTTAESSGNGTLELSQGWVYKGEYVQGLFHGYGELFHQNKLIYSGKFEYGYFSGYGKLQFHHVFQNLISAKSISNFLEARAQKRNQLQYGHEIMYNWTAYFGQFKKGTIKGFGQLWISTGEKIISKWNDGRPHKKHCSVISSSSIN